MELVNCLLAFSHLFYEPFFHLFYEPSGIFASILQAIFPSVLCIKSCFISTTHEIYHIINISAILTIKAAALAPTATVKSPFLANANTKATIVPAIAETSPLVEKRIAGKVIAPRTA